MNDDQNKSASHDTENEALRRAMFLRRCFLILAVPLLLFLTIFSLQQWQRVWRLLLP